MVVVFFLFSSVILLTSLQPGKWNFIVFVLSTYLFLLEAGVADGFAVALTRGMAVGFAVGLGVAVAFGVAVGVFVALTNGSAFAALLSALSVSATEESAVIVIRPDSVN